MDMIKIFLKTDAQGNYDQKESKKIEQYRDRANSELFNEGMDIVNEAMIDIRTSHFNKEVTKQVDFREIELKNV